MLEIGNNKTVSNVKVAKNTYIWMVGLFNKA